MINITDNDYIQCKYLIINRDKIYTCIYYIFSGKHCIHIYMYL